MLQIVRVGLWDEKDNFFYDVLENKTGELIVSKRVSLVKRQG